MTDIVLNHMTNGNNISVANNNFDKIQANINTTSVQSVGGNNIMGQDLDLDSHQLLNVGTISTQNFVLRGEIITTDELIAVDPTILAPLFASPPAGIGSVTPTTGVFTTLVSNSLSTGNISTNGQVNSVNTTQSTSVGTGSIVTAGGLGVSKDIFCGGSYHGAIISASGQLDNIPIGATTPNTGAFTTLKATTLDSTNIGSITPAAGSFTNLSATGTLTGIKGRLINVRTITTTGAYTPTTGTNAVLIYLVGGGGGAGGCAAPSATTVGATGGGAAGGMCIHYMTSGFSGQTITIGTAGTGGAIGANPGTAGGNSTFGAILTASGGGASGAASLVAPPQIQAGSSAGGTATGGNVANITGEGGSPPLGLTTAFTMSGKGGNSPLGGAGGRQVVTVSGSTATAGNNALAPGGGGGGSVVSSSAATGAAGGSGTAGVCIIYEYS